jgi:FMN-dependent NADH-azoreductase
MSTFIIEINEVKKLRSAVLFNFSISRRRTIMLTTKLNFEHPYDRVLNRDLAKAQVNNNTELSFEHPYAPVPNTNQEPVSTNKGRNVELSFEHPYDRVPDGNLAKARVKNTAELSFEHPFSGILV